MPVHSVQAARNSENGEAAKQETPLPTSHLQPQAFVDRFGQQGRCPRAPPLITYCFINPDSLLSFLITTAKGTGLNV